MNALLKTITEALAKRALDNADRAYAILGAKPGPGIDIEIWPVEPICGKWYASGCTQAGRRFINKFWADQPLPSNHTLGQLKREAIDWGLKFRVILNFERIKE